MKRLLLFFGTLIYYSIPCFAQSEYVESNLIYWTPDYRLTYTDFEALPERYSEHAAYSVIGFKTTYEITGEQYKIEIQAYFEKDSSWARSWVPILLAHEQGHFDMAELYARIYRQRLEHAMKADTLTVSGIESTISHIVEDLEKAQLEYDEATNYSRDFRAQLEWIDIIKERLDKLDAFSDSEVIVKRP